MAHRSNVTQVCRGTLPYEGCGVGRKIALAEKLKHCYRNVTGAEISRRKGVK
jgi:hypothetical protein